MLQLLYMSTARPEAQPIDVEAMLEQTRRNNARDEITGLLYTDGQIFVQVLEGPKTVVEDTFLRIIVDPRHHHLLLLSRREIAYREFGPWSMGWRSASQGDEYILRIRELCRHAPSSVLEAFLGGSDEQYASHRQRSEAGSA